MDTLPIEDLAAGRYVHGTPVTTIIDADGTTRYLVSAEDFMDVQAERDEYRRVAALINAWRRDGDRDEQALAQLLARVALGDAEADAMRSIIASVRAGI